MTLRDFYGLIVERAFTNSLDRARKVGFVLTIAGAIFQYFYPPSEFSIIGTLLIPVWLVPLCIIVFTWIRRLIRAPYELYCDLAEELRADKQERMTAEERKQIRDELGAFAIAGQTLIAQFASLLYNKRDAAQNGVAWVLAVDEYVEKRLGREYRARLWQNAYIPKRRVTDTLMLDLTFPERIRTRCSNLMEIMKDFS